MLKRFLLLLTVPALWAAYSANASLAGHNVVLIHGLQPETIAGQSLSRATLDTNGAAYWSEFWLANSEALINWDSNERINGGIAADVRDQVVALARAGTCNGGCIFVTHSTGDLVARMLFDRQEAWLAPLGLQPLRVVASIDLAGAGGGTELADLAVDIAGDPFLLGFAARTAVELFLGVSDVTTDTLGTVNDLRVSTARSIATAPNAALRLRVVGGGDDFFGLTKLLISGTDDSVVPLHSACASSRAESIDSCSNNIDLDGTLTSSDGPSGRLFNHFPILMAEDASHLGIRDRQEGSRVVPVFNNFRVGGTNLTVDFNTRVERGFFWRRFQFIPGAPDTFVSDVIFETLNN